MPFSDTYKLIFFHVPRTGGSSLEVYFDMQHESMLFLRKHIYVEDGIRFCPQHLLPHQVLRHIGATKFNQYFKFAFFRNPYTRVLSEYFYRRQLEGDNNTHFDSKDFRLWFFKFYDKLNHDHKIPQYLYSQLNGKYTLDFHGLFEQYNNDTNTLFQKVKHYKGPIFHKNKSNNSKDIKIDIDIKNEIFSIYKKDFQLFGYH